MVLEPQGFVARIAEDLERTISQGRLPKDGSLPSEQLLAKTYGVSRSTVREALKQLAARGVVVQHPGRRNRAARLDVAITIENLSVALHAVGPAHPERLRLLEGYLSLKRETAVELLAACCEHASQKDLDSRPGWGRGRAAVLRPLKTPVPQRRPLTGLGHANSTASPLRRRGIDKDSSRRGC